MPRSGPQSALRYPLTGILGSVANIRVLRELLQHGGEIAPPSLVLRTRLAQSSVREALIALESMKVVEAIGGGRHRLFRIVLTHPLTGPLERLFQAEGDRFDRILNSIRTAAGHYEHSVLAAWIYGSVARGRDRSTSDLDIAVIAVAEDLSRVEAGMRQELETTELELAFTASVVVIAPLDLIRLSEENDPWLIEAIKHTVPVLGHRPEALLASLRAADKRARRSVG